MEIKKATRQGIKPLIGIYGESGTGKSMSALLLARGFAGDGRIVMIDTESGRGSLYADVIKDGYDVIELREPFSPERYVEAIKFVEESGASILVIDSASHEHEGLGGVLDMANQNEERSGKPGLHNWKAPKMSHQKFMLKLLQSSLPIIVCLRAKYKTRQTKDERGKTAIVKDEYTSPIQSEDFIYEMTAHAEVLHNHSIILTKVSHPTLRDCFPKDKTTPITIEHGAKLAEWCNAAGKPFADLPDGKKLRNKKELELELWLLLKPKRIQGHKSWISSGAWQFIVDECEVDPNATIDSLTVSEIEQLIVRAKSKL